MEDFLARNLEYLRKQKGWSQDEVAKIIGTKNGSVSSYENGRTRPPIDKAMLLAEVFEVSLDDLVKVDLTSSSKTTALQSEFERRLAALEQRILTNPNPKDLATLDELVRVLKEKYPEVAGELGL